MSVAVVNPAFPHPPQVKPGTPPVPLHRPLALVKWKNAAGPVPPCPIQLKVKLTDSSLTLTYMTTFANPTQLTDVMVTIPFETSETSPLVWVSTGTSETSAGAVQWRIGTHRHYPSDLPPVESVEVLFKGKSVVWGEPKLEATSTVPLYGHGFQALQNVGEKLPVRSKHRVVLQCKTGS